MRYFINSYNYYSVEIPTFVNEKSFRVIFNKNTKDERLPTL